MKWRLHTHFEVERFVPIRIDVTPNGGGEHDERAVLERTLASDRLYVMDRGYAKFALFNQIVKQDSSDVCRRRDNSAYEVLEDRPLTDADRAAGILSDQRLWTGRKPTKRTYEMVCYYFLGLASEAELLAHIDKLKRQDAAKHRA